MIQLPAHATDAICIPAEVEDTRRRAYLSICLIASIALGAGFGLADLSQGRVFEGIAELGIALVFFGMLIGARRATHLLPFFHAFTALIVAFLLLELAIGGAGGHVFLWILLMPAVIFGLFGKRIGSIWLLVPTVGSIWIFISEHTHPYSPEVILRFSVVFVVVSGLTFALEASREANLRQLEKDTLRLSRALRHAKTLRGLIPLCPACHRLRDDQGFWQRVESYLTERAGTRLSHGLCPDCFQIQVEALKLAKRSMSEEG